MTVRGDGKRGCVAVAGSLNMDLVARVERLPEEGETLLASTLTEEPGGKGANQAAAIGKLGAFVSIIGKVGADKYGERVMSSLHRAGVDTSPVMIADEPTGLAFITVDGAGHNQIVVVPGANGELTPADIELQRRVLEQCDMLVLQLETPLETVLYALRLAKELGKTTLLNPAPARALSDELLRYVDFLIPNEHELQVISGETPQDEAGLTAAAAKLVQRGAKTVIVTLGDKGCCCTNQAGSEFYEACKVEALDTTAAGDSFIGGFAAAYADGADISASIRQAIKTAALTVTRHGAQSSLPTAEEVAAFSYKGQKREWQR
jgi:ribokinase